MSELVPTVVQPEWLDNLRHMLGATSGTPKKSHGYRNHFCVDVGYRDHATMQAMEAAGLVQAGRVMNEGRGRYYHATVAGCQAIGLSKAAIKRAFED